MGKMKRRRKTISNTGQVHAVPDDNLRHKRKMITLVDGPLAGEMYVNAFYAYIFLPNVARHDLFAYNEVGYNAKEWLFYRNCGSGSKHKNKGADYKLDSVYKLPEVETEEFKLYSLIAVARKASWERKEFLVFQNQY